MINLDSTYNDPQIQLVLTMKPGDRLRDGHIISHQCFAALHRHPVRVLTRVGIPLFLAIKSVFIYAINYIRDQWDAYKLRGFKLRLRVSPIIDKNEFEKIYPKLAARVKVLKEKIEQSEGKNLETFYEIKHLLKIYAKLRLSWAGRELRETHPEFNQLRVDLKELRKAAIPLVKEWEKEHPTLDRVNLKRWIDSTSLQRKFASWYDEEELPWRADEIPAGCVLLTDMERDAVGLWIRDYRLSSGQQFKRVQADAAGVLTGGHVSHAALCVGNRTIFHIDKPDGVTGDWKGIYENYTPAPGRKEKSFHRYRIVAPNLSRDQVSEVVDQARQRESYIKANLKSLARVINPFKKRSQDYTYTPNDKRLYACSSSIADLFYRTGVDIGAGNEVKIENFAPADYLTSTSFHIWGERDLAAPDLSHLSEDDRNRVYHLVWEAMGSPTGPGTENIGEREAYSDIERLKKAYDAVRPRYRLMANA